MISIITCKRWWNYNLWVESRKVKSNLRKWEVWVAIYITGGKGNLLNKHKRSTLWQALFFTLHKFKQSSQTPYLMEYYPHFTSKGTEAKRLNDRVAVTQVMRPRTVVQTWNPCPQSHSGLYGKSDVPKAILRLTFYLPSQSGWFLQCGNTYTPVVDSNSSDTPQPAQASFPFPCLRNTDT